MPRDYKHRRPKEKRAPCWAWLVVGLLIGLFGAFLVYIKEHPRVALVTGLASEPATSPVETNKGNKDSRQAHRPPKPRFEFYTVLPEMEVRVPGEQLPKRGTRRQESVADSASYVLQVASFKNHQEADRLKARLALLGMEAKIQTVSVDGKQTWHRVRLGPISREADVEDLHRRLKEINLKAIIFKVKG